MTAPATDIPGMELLERCDKPLIILFYDTNPVCKEIVPGMEKTIGAQTDKAGRAKFNLVKIDADKYGRLADEFGIKSVPTLVGFHGNKASFGMVGRMPEKYFMEFLCRVEDFHKANPPPAWMVPEPEPVPDPDVHTGSTIKVMKPLRIGRKTTKKRGWGWLR